jgi:hypothetical protein
MVRPLAVSWFGAEGIFFQHFLNCTYWFGTDNDRCAPLRFEVLFYLIPEIILGKCLHEEHKLADRRVRQVKDVDCTLLTGHIPLLLLEHIFLRC